MFVKFVNYPEDRTIENTSELLFECNDYSFNYDIKNYKEGTFFISMKNGGTRQHRFILHQTKIYIMSDTGKTIDSFVWSEDQENTRCVRH